MARIASYHAGLLEGQKRRQADFDEVTGRFYPPTWTGHPGVRDDDYSCLVAKGIATGSTPESTCGVNQEDRLSLIPPV